MENAFYSILKALFFLKMFKFFSWLFAPTKKNSLIRKMMILKFMTSQPV